MSKGGIVWLKTINHNAIENNFVQVIKCQCKSLVLLKTEFLTSVSQVIDKIVVEATFDKRSILELPQCIAVV